MATSKRVLVLSALPGPTTIGMHNPQHCACPACTPQSYSQILSPRAVIERGDEFEFAHNVWARSTRIGALAGFKCRYRRPLP